MKILLILWFLLNIAVPVGFCQEDMEYLKKGVVRVQIVTFEDTERIGTGFIIQQREDALYILTPSHVVEGAQKIQIEFYTLRNQQIPATILRTEGEEPTGLAILEVIEKIPSEVSVLSLSSSISLYENDRVTIVGFPIIADIEWAVTTGIIAGRVARRITFAGNVEQGHSGAPLVKEGKVIGIVTHKKGDFAYALPALFAEYVLESWGIQQEGAGKIQRDNLLVNGDFSAEWNIGWKQDISPVDQDQGSVIITEVAKQQLQFKGACHFCAISQSIPIDGLRGLRLEISFRAKACLGTEKDCRRGLEGLRYMNSYDLAGLQVEYQNERQEPLGILRFVDITSGYVVGAGLIGAINAPETGNQMWKAIKIGDNWQTLELDLYAEVENTFAFTPEQVKHILIAFFNSRAGEEPGFGEITVDSVKLYYE